MSDLTLNAANLTVPMVPADSDPSILPWRMVRSYRLHYSHGVNFAAAWVIPVSSWNAVDVQVWKASCVGPGEFNMAEAAFPTAEEARAAVEQHVLDHLDVDLMEEDR